MSHIYFVERGMVSVNCEAQPNHHIEVGMVGCEGMTGSCIVLGDDRSTNQSFVPAGSAMRLSTQAFRDVTDASRTVSATLLRCVKRLYGAGQPRSPIAAAGSTCGSPAGS